MAEAKRDQNFVTSVLMESSITPGLTIPVKGDEVTGRMYVDLPGGGSGTVTSVSVATANGFAGSVATETTTPAITVRTTITGILQGNGTAVSAATTTGSGSVVLATSPILVTPALGTPTALIGTNITGTASALTAGSVTTNANLTGAVTSSGNATVLGSFTSSQLATALTDETGTGANVFAASPTLVTPLLGTPTSGNLANCTFPTFNQSTTGTSAGLTGTPSITVATITTTGAIELGNASDTTLSRSAAGVLAVEGVVIPSLSSTNTLTNKRITRRVVTTTQSATPAINTDNTDVSSITGLAQAITSMSSSLTGTPFAGDILIIEITDNGTARAITWGASFTASTVALPTTTVISTLLTVGFRRTNANSAWVCVAVA